MLENIEYFPPRAEDPPRIKMAFSLVLDCPIIMLEIRFWDVINRVKASRSANIMKLLAITGEGAVELWF